MVRVFANGLGDQGSIPCLVKKVLDAFLLSTQHYNVWIKDNWSNSENEVAPSSTPRFSSYWKGSLWVTPNYSWPTYNLYFGECINSNPKHLYKFSFSSSFWFKIFFSEQIEHISSKQYSYTVTWYNFKYKCWFTD